MVKQIVCREPNSKTPWEALALIESPEPVAGPGEVVVELKARPINPADILLLSGRHMVQLAKDTAVGIEGAGVVCAVGEGVSLRQGQAVAVPYGGTWRESICLSAEEVIVLPEDIDLQQASMLSVNPVTAAGLLEGVASGEAIVLNAANSALGRMILAICARRGIRAIAVVRRAAAGQGLEELGAYAVLVDDENGIAEAVTEAAGDRILVRALDAVAGQASARLHRCVADGGDLVVYGLLSSDRVELLARDVVFRDVAVRGYSRLRTLRRMSAERRAAVWAELIELMRQGVLQSPVARTFALEEAAEAVRFHESEKRQGKVLLLS